MAPEAAHHHHRSTTKSTHKSFKSRHSTKGAIKERAKGMPRTIGSAEGKATRSTPHQQVLSKFDRRNQAKQRRLAKRATRFKTVDIFSGRNQAPRIVAIVPLCDDVSPAAAVQIINSSLDIDVAIPESGFITVNIEKFRQKIQYVIVGRDLFTALDACRLADFVIFLLSSKSEVDSHGECLMKSVESQGVSNVFAVVEGLNNVPSSKRKQQILSSSKSIIQHYFPPLEKIQSLDFPQDCINLLRTLCAVMPKGVRWRDDRSWMLVEDVHWLSGSDSEELSERTGAVVLTGFVRGQNLKANRVVQVGDWGTFQVDKITAAHPQVKKGITEQDPDREGEVILDQPTEDQDSLDQLAPEDADLDNLNSVEAPEASSERKGVLLDEHRYFRSDSADAVDLPQRLPRGTSKYQAAWYLGDVSDSGSDVEELQEDVAELMQLDNSPDLADGLGDGDGDEVQMDASEAGPSDYARSETYVNPPSGDEHDQLAAYRSERKVEAEVDLQFPDEVELQPQVSARQRLSRYRGLRSLRTSRWDTEQDKLFEPLAWARLLRIANYKASKSRMISEALEGGVCSGSRVRVHLRNVPTCVSNHHDPSRPLGLYSLLRHECKHTAVHYSITLPSNASVPLRSKEELIVQCGPRRLLATPIFSMSGDTPNNVHKFCRYVHPGQTSVASFIGPLTWGPVPVLFFRHVLKDSAEQDVAASHDLTPVATGTVLPSSTDRVIAKRIVLTGHPYKIHKRVVTVRYMFFNAADVEWFRALRLWTKRGRSGFIKESLGTHGYFKAHFEGSISSLDTVAMSLYKRLWPRQTTAWNVLSHGLRTNNDGEADVMRID